MILDRISQVIGAVESLNGGVGDLAGAGIDAGRAVGWTGNDAYAAGNQGSCATRVGSAGQNIDGNGEARIRGAEGVTQAGPARIIRRQADDLVDLSGTGGQAIRVRDGEPDQIGAGETCGSNVGNLPGGRIDGSGPMRWRRGNV